MRIERFKHFKGIQLSTTGEYFCCDFYEIVHPDSSITYRVNADSRLRKLSTEMFLADDVWNSSDSTIPEELQQLLRQEVEKTFYKPEATQESPVAPTNKQTFLSRFKTYILRKL